MFEKRTARLATEKTPPVVLLFAPFTGLKAGDLLEEIMAIRKQISKRTRFEIFKRDAFECQYCGAHPPAAILEVDHIEAVANGGGNDADNLVTACFDCNRGKSDVSLSIVPQSLSEKANEIKEREAQLLGYREIMQAKLDRVEDDAWLVVRALFGESANSINRQYFQSIKNFNARLDLHVVLDSAQIARAKYMSSHRKLFLYFCGICWRRIRDEDA